MLACFGKRVTGLTSVEKRNNQASVERDIVTSRTGSELRLRSIPHKQPGLLCTCPVDYTYNCRHGRHSVCFSDVAMGRLIEHNINEYCNGIPYQFWSPF